MLNKDFVLNKWVPALLSGEYLQARGALNVDNEQFCCLGVAACTMDKVHWRAPQYDPEGNERDYEESTAEFDLVDEISGAASSDVLPYAVGDRIGLFAGHLVPVPEHLIRRTTDCGDEECMYCVTHYFDHTGRNYTLTRDVDSDSTNYYLDLAAINDGDATFEDIAAILQFIAENEEDENVG